MKMIINAKAAREATDHKIKISKLAADEAALIRVEREDAARAAARASYSPIREKINKAIQDANVHIAHVDFDADITGVVHLNMAIAELKSAGYSTTVEYCEGLDDNEGPSVPSSYRMFFTW
jgi:hypothetical protein